MKNIFLKFGVLILSIHGYSQTIINTPGTTYETAPGDANGYIIETGSRLVLQAGIYEFDPGKGIEVLSGGNLFLDGPIMELRCSNPAGFWNGITVYGSGVPYSTTNPSFENWGLNSKHSFNIRNAVTGIYMNYPTAIYNTTTFSVEETGNGYARSMHTYNWNGTCNFTNNRLYDIRIHNYYTTIADNHSRSNTKWEDFNFTTNSTSFIASLDFRHTNLQTQIENFSISSTKDGIHLDNSNFVIHDSEIYAGNVSAMGIVHRISNNNLKQTVIGLSQIKGYTFGIYSEGSKSLAVRSCKITAKEYSMYLFETVNAVASENTLLYANFGLEARATTNTELYTNMFVDNPTMSLYINGSTETGVFGNLIAWNSGTVLSNQGIQVSNSNETNIINNKFRRANQQLRFTGAHPNVNIKCNVFENPGAAIDAAIVNQDSPLNNQGDITGGANNWFNTLPGAITRVRNLFGIPVVFYNSSPYPFGPNTPSVNAFFVNNPLLPVNCNYFKTAQTTENIEEGIANDFSPTPNPFTNYINVGENTTSIQVYSISGQLIEHLENSGSEINLGHLSPGTYMVVLHQNDGGQSRHKLVKQ